MLIWDMMIDELLALSKTTILKMIVEMSLSIEKGNKVTRLWFTFTAGRVTASIMKSVCHANPANPLQSCLLIRRV